MLGIAADIVIILALRSKVLEVIMVLLKSVAKVEVREGGVEGRGGRVGLRPHLKADPLPSGPDPSKLSTALEDCRLVAFIQQLFARHNSFFEKRSIIILRIMLDYYLTKIILII